MSDLYSVLLIDDHQRLRELYKIALQDERRLHVSAEAADGLEGARLAREMKPDLVVLDLSMPTRDGLQALQDIKRDVPDARIVVLSGFLRDRVEPLVLELGANAYVEKGLPIEEIPVMLLRVAREEPRLATREYSPSALETRVRDLV